jgi:Biopolymer transport proteins
MRSTPLGIDENPLLQLNQENPFLFVYLTLKKNAEALLERRAGKPLSSEDIALLQAEVKASKDQEIHALDKHLFLLSIVVSLAPFLGLLGTVWGILTTFSNLQTQTGGGTNDLVLGGLSLALATTVLGLLDAIPALIAYHFLKTQIKTFDLSLGQFSTSLVTAVELKYRG